MAAIILSPVKPSLATIKQIKTHLNLKKLEYKQDKSITAGFKLIIGDIVHDFTLDVVKPISYSQGHILQINDGVALADGLSNCQLGEILSLPNETQGLALNLEPNETGIVIMGDYQHLKPGDKITTTGKILSIPVDKSLLGRVVDPLGRPLDGLGEYSFKTEYPLEKIAPGVIARQAVNQPLQTGIKAVDSMIPIGRGQRELIIGDRGTGKSAIALTTIINQRKTDVISIYVIIGQKRAFLAQLINYLKKFGQLEKTIIVAATASDSAVLQYLAPYAGTAIAEYFLDQGKDSLVVYDDLSKHAWAYREISLLLRRPSGREAYPGDIFYAHSRLLERACKLNPDHGNGSITALPIIETQAGDVSAYIPTNVISITDGQIYLEADLFNSGQRPAINTGLSVSRVGGAAQTKAMKSVAGKLRFDLAQYRELAAFAQFASDLDETTQKQLTRGARLTEILKQNWDKPMTIENQVCVIYMANQGYLDKFPVNQAKQLEKDFLDYLHQQDKKFFLQLKKEAKLTDKLEAKLKKFTEKFFSLK